jgi:hypothetical protein
MKVKKVVLVFIVLNLIVPVVVSQRNLAPAVEITYPPDGSIIKGTITIQVSTAGCIDMVEFYIDGEFKYADTIAPFNYTWYAVDQVPGKHIITVKGYCSGEFKDDDSITVKVV